MMLWIAVTIAGASAGCGGKTRPGPGGGDGSGSGDPVAVECEANACGPALGMPTEQCSDGSVGGNTGRCLKNPDGACGWEIRECPASTTTSDCVTSGCSGTLCVEPGKELATTCEMKPEYACYRDAACERQADGACGWTQSAALTTCLANPPPL
jgi:hypothetical protein